MTPKEKGQNEQNEKYDTIKSILMTREGLGIICYSKNHYSKKINCTKLSEILKIPKDKLKDTCSKLEKLNLIKIFKIGKDIEIELNIDENDDKLKEIIDAVIWENKTEYGEVYKRIMTADLLNFFNGENQS